MKKSFKKSNNKKKGSDKKQNYNIAFLNPFQDNRFFLKIILSICQLLIKKIIGFITWWKNSKKNDVIKYI